MTMGHWNAIVCTSLLVATGVYIQHIKTHRRGKTAEWARDPNLGTKRECKCRQCIRAGPSIEPHASVPDLEESGNYETAPMRKTEHTTELELPSRGREPSWAKKYTSLRPAGQGQGHPDADLGTADNLRGPILVQCWPSADLQQ